MADPKAPIRPRDEDFDVESPVRRKSAEELKVKSERHDQSAWVICVILLSAVVIAVLGILIYSALKAHQRTVVNVVTATESSEDFRTQYTETTTTQPEITIDEKTRATTETETEESSAEDAESPEDELQEAEGADASADASDAAETFAAAEDPGEDREYGGVVYHIANGEAVLIRCYSSDAIMWMPSSVYDARCVAIAAGAFQDCSHLIAIELPNGYVSIGSGAFSNCANLKTVVIPDTVTAIGDQAFLGDASVTITSSAGSYARSYAETAGIPWTEGSALSVN